LPVVVAPGCATRKIAAAPAAAASPATVTPPPSVATETKRPADAGPSAEGELAAAPSPIVPAAGKTTIKTDATWASCRPKRRSNGSNPAAEVAALTRACASVTKMKPVGKTIIGKQTAADSPQSYPFPAEANHCYRVYVEAEAGIEDIEVVIDDSAGIAAGQGSSGGPPAVVLENGAVCFKERDAATVAVSVGRGGGTYALEIWSD
jgi:hypothetical protein